MKLPLLPFRALGSSRGSLHLLHAPSADFDPSAFKAISDRVSATTCLAAARASNFWLHVSIEPPALHVERRRKICFSATVLGFVSVSPSGNNWKNFTGDGVIGIGLLLDRLVVEGCVCAAPKLRFSSLSSSWRFRATVFSRAALLYFFVSRGSFFFFALSPRLQP